MGKNICLIYQGLDAICPWVWHCLHKMKYSYSLLSDSRKVALHCDLLMMVLHESKPGFPLILPGYLIAYT